MSDPLNAVTQIHLLGQGDTVWCGAVDPINGEIPEHHSCEIATANCEECLDVAEDFGIGAGRKLKHVRLAARRAEQARAKGGQ